MTFRQISQEVLINTNWTGGKFATRESERWEMGIDHITSFSFPLWSLKLICSTLRSGTPNNQAELVCCSFICLFVCFCFLIALWASASCWSLGSSLHTGLQGPDEGMVTFDLSGVITMPNRADVNPRTCGWGWRGRVPYSRVHEGCLSGEKSQRSMWGLN